MTMRLHCLVPILCALLFPVGVAATGAHDKVGCNGCHAQKQVMAGNKTYLDPETKQPYTGSTAICLACHQAPEAGGKGNAPVWRHTSHPFGMASVNPRKAKVPPEMLVNGRFECMSCHDPHPSNPHYKYLRLDVVPKGENLDGFCASCHPAKAG